MNIESTTVVRKRDALALFTHLLLSSKAGEHIARVILFGSIKKGEVRPDSDVDVLVLTAGSLKETEETVADCALEVGMQTGESVEPLVYCIDELRFPGSYFLYFNLNNGEEIYSMDETELRQSESRGYMELAEEYLDGARCTMQIGHYRLAVDAAYNAAELCAKGFLVLELQDMPSSRGGVILKFSEIYIKTDKLPRKLGRHLNQALAMRNKARYDRHAAVGKTEAEFVMGLTGEMIHALGGIL